MMNRKWFAAVVCGAVLMFAGARDAKAITIIDGTVWAGLNKYLLTGSPVNVTGNAVLKISFGTTTAGSNLSLCAGSIADFAAGHCATQLNDSGGPGYTFLTIVDAASLNGKHLFVIRSVGINDASFRFTIE
jgi:hypothetical protein